MLASPSPAKLSVNTHSLVGIRARYLQPYEDHVLGGGVGILDAVDRGDRARPGGDGFVVRTRPSSGGPAMAFETDEVIAATGFVAPLRDLPALGVATFGQSRLPAQTPCWESATVPGIFFAGTIGQGVAGPQEARHPGQLRRRPRRPLQRALPGPPHRPDALRRASRSGRRSTRPTCVDFVATS